MRYVSIAAVLLFPLTLFGDDVIYSATFRDGQMIDVAERAIHVTARSYVPFVPTAAPARPVVPRSVINPRLTAKIRIADPVSTIDLVVVFTEDVTIAPFPRMDHSLPRSHPSNVAVENEVHRRIDELTAQRQRANGQRVREIEALGSTIREQYWLVNAVLVQAPMATIPRLAARPDVVSIDEAKTDDPPPVIIGRQQMNTFWLESLVPQTQTGNPWHFALLDTGAPPSHALFTPRTSILGAYDCVNGTSNNCRSGTLLNPEDNCSHGTPSAGILVANNSLGSQYQGVTRFGLRSYKVYPSCVNGVTGLDTAAVLRAFQAAIYDVSDVIIAEMQAAQSDTGSISAAADAAYDAGYVVIAANGNYGLDGAGSVRAPAIAHKAIGVGSILDGTQDLDQGLGPTPDGRVKPDVQATSGAASASSAGYTAVMQRYGGTSGATPFAAAAAALLGYWRDPYGAPPGYVYARLINWGSNFTDASTNNTTGAGLMVLPGANGTASWGSTWVANGQSVDITFTVPANSYDLRAALWWPESASQTHNNVDVLIYQPTGAYVAGSFGYTSVFEKAFVSGPLIAGTYIVRIHGANIFTAGAQRVYFDIYARN